MWTKKCFIIIIRIIIVQENGFIMPLVWLSLDSLTAYSGPFFFNSWHEYSSVKRCWFGNKTGKRISNHHYSKILNVSPDCQLVTAEKSLIFGLREKKNWSNLCWSDSVCMHTHTYAHTDMHNQVIPPYSLHSISICQHMSAYGSVLWETVEQTDPGLMLLWRSWPGTEGKKGKGIGKGRK